MCTPTTIKQYMSCQWDQEHDNCILWTKLHQLVGLQFLNFGECGDYYNSQNPFISYENGENNDYFTNMILSIDINNI